VVLFSFCAVARHLFLVVSVDAVVMVLVMVVMLC